MTAGSLVAGGATSADVALPVTDINQALLHLRRPFTPEAIRFKVQNVYGDAAGCIIVGYIDARLVVERLNTVVGGDWSASYRAAQKENLLLCDLTVFGVTRTDVGESLKGPSKDLVSDALKRAAVMFGVGVSVYALPQITWRAEDRIPAGLLRQRQIKGKATLVLTDAGHMALRQSYLENWLAPFGRDHYGPELAHGDQGGAFDPSAEDPDEFVAAPAAAVADEEGVALIEACRAKYQEIVALGREAQRSLPAGTFNQMLTGAQHSHAELLRLQDYLQNRLDGLVRS